MYVVLIKKKLKRTNNLTRRFKSHKSHWVIEYKRKRKKEKIKENKIKYNTTNCSDIINSAKRKRRKKKKIKRKRGTQKERRKKEGKTNRTNEI